jgi:SAM-dependent methyltransferase
MRLRAGYFEDLYARDPDPWGFATSEYEAAKYADTLAALDPPYGSILELGCSIGVLSAELAQVTDDLLGIDVAERALEQARERVPGARFERREIPEEWPDGHFGLIVASEVLYYFDDDALDQVIGLIGRSGDSLLAVHWRHPTRTYPQLGDDVHARLRTLGWPCRTSMHTPDYVLERFDRP